MFKNSDRLILINEKNQLLVKKTKKSEYTTLGLIAFMLGVVVLMSGYPSSDNLKFNYLFYGFIVVSLLLGTYKPIKTLVSKDHFIFDQFTQKISKKETILAAFAEVDYVEIRVIVNSEKKEDTYLLNLRLHNKSSIEMDNRAYKADVKKVAEEIAAFIQKDVKRK